MTCPRCNVALATGTGVLGEDVCSLCRGRFFSPQLTERVLLEELGLEKDALHEIAKMFSGPRLLCASCRAQMSPLRIRGVQVDLCFGCGGLWLDAGELAALSGGRYTEPAAPPRAANAKAPELAVVVGRPATSTVALGRGKHAVLLDELRAPDVNALGRAFARTDGLTPMDAQMLVRNLNGVLAEGVSDVGANGLVAALKTESIGAHAVLDSALVLPNAVQSNDLDIEKDVINVRFMTGPAVQFAWADVAAVVGGNVRREKLRHIVNEQMRNAPGRNDFEPDVHLHEVVESAEVVVELLVATAAPRRLRVPKSPRRGTLQRDLVDQALAKGVPCGRAAQGEWPFCRRPRELERELAWVAWRAGRWPRR